MHSIQYLGNGEAHYFLLTGTDVFLLLEQHKNKKQKPKPNVSPLASKSSTYVVQRLLNWDQNGSMR